MLEQSPDSAEAADALAECSTLVELLEGRQAALAATLAWSTPEALLPPLERFADTASICLLGWAFVVPERRRGRGWRFLLGANLILAVGVCVGFTLSWGGT